MATLPEKLKFELSRLKGFLGAFKRSKAGITGVIILAIFAIVAVGAPFMTPYDPITTIGLAAPNAAPAWLRSLPPQLGGQPDRSENYMPMQNPGFAKDTSIWNITQTQQVETGWTQNVQGRDGVFTVAFDRTETGKAYGNNTIEISQDFYYPFTGRPGTFFGDIAVLINGTYTVQKETYFIVNPNKTEFDQGIWFINQTLIKHVLIVPIRVNVFVQRLNDSRTWVLWPLNAPAYVKLNPTYLPAGMSIDGTIKTFNSTKWITTTDMPLNSMSTSISTFFSGRAEHLIFGKDYAPGYYRYGMRITFQDFNATRPASAQVYIDTLNFRFLGNSYGLLGTDFIGRDIWTQLLHGTKISLYVGLLSAIIGVVIGLIVGLAAGYMGKAVDEILMRFNDMLLVLPTLPLLIVLMAVLSPTLETLILVLGFLGWMGFARLVRSQVLSLRERPFVEAAKAIGASKTHIMLRHILPNVVSLIYVTLATSVPGNIVAEAALSWLGFFDPYRMSWGRMLYDVQFRAQAVTNWWWVVPPGLAIAALAISFIMLGYALDDILNPKLRARR